MEQLLSITIFVAGALWVSLLLLAFFGKVFSSLWHKQKPGYKWQEKGVEAEAVVLKLEETGLLVNDQPQVKLQMQVKPDKGRNFVIEIQELGKGFLLLKAGSIVRVKYNPHNYRELFLIPEAAFMTS